MSVWFLCPRVAGRETGPRGGRRGQTVPSPLSLSHYFFAQKGLGGLPYVLKVAEPGLECRATTHSFAAAGPH